MRFLLEGPGSPIGLVLLLTAFLFLLVGGFARAIGERLGGTGIVVVGLNAIASMGWLEDGVRSEAMYWLPFLPIAAALLVDQRTAVVATLAASMVTLVLGWGHPDDVLHVGAVLGAVWFGALLATAYDAHRQQERTKIDQREQIQTQLLGALPECVLVVGPDDNVTFGTNLAGVFGAEQSAQLSTHPHLKTIPSDLRNEVFASVEGVRTDGVPTSRRVCIGSGIQARTLQIRALPMQSQRIALILVDESETERLNHLKDEFISTVSHELRTPLTAMSGALTLLHQGGNNLAPAQSDQLLDIAVRNTQRLTQLVNDLLDLRSIDLERLPVRPVPVDLHGLVQDTVVDLHRLAQDADITVSVAVDDGCFVMADPGRTSQILTNVLGNALKFSGRGTNVQITFDMVGAFRSVTVRDQGPGVPPSSRQRVFERFQQLDASASRKLGGSGLGLAISRSLAENMGGTLEIVDTMGRGASFRLTLPKRR